MRAPLAIATSVAFLAAHSHAKPEHGYVVVDATEKYGVRFKKGTAPSDAIAWAVYDEEPYHSTGWASLDLHANAA